MRDIAKDAGASLSSLYDYFETNDAFFGSSINRGFRVIDESIDPEYLRKMGKMHGRLVNGRSD